MTIPDLRTAGIVVTGADSGVGRATVRALNELGAQVVMVARDAGRLAEVHATLPCPERALVVPADVTDRTALERAGAAALRRCGRLDGWVDAAAVAMYAPFEGLEPSEMERAFSVNVVGAVNGAQVALRSFRAQGWGTLVHVGSVLAHVTVPYLTGYVVTKHALRALSGCLRGELRGERHIHVCEVHPGTVATALYEHAANHTGRRIRPMEPRYKPEQVADAIVRVLRRPRRSVFVGRSMRGLALAQVVAPRATEAVMARYVSAVHITDEPAPDREGNLFVPVREGTVPDAVAP